MQGSPSPIFIKSAMSTQTRPLSMTVLHHLQLHHQCLFWCRPFLLNCPSLSEEQPPLYHPYLSSLVLCPLLQSTVVISSLVLRPLLQSSLILSFLALYPLLQSSLVLSSLVLHPLLQSSLVLSSLVLHPLLQSSLCQIFLLQSMGQVTLV